MFLKVIFVFTILFSGRGFSACNINNADDILNLIKMHHPSIKLNNSKQLVLEKNIDLAEQRPNPEIGLASSIGDSIAGNVYTNAISFQHIIEVGGKRASRVKKATLEKFAGGTVAGNENQETIIDAIIKIHKIRQINELTALYAESLGAFNKIIRRMRGWKSLSPEQHVEKLTLELVINDYKLKISKLKADKIYINKHLTFYMGGNCVIPERAIPKLVKLDEDFASNISVEGHAKLRSARYNLEIATVNYQLEKAKSYPDIKIGPSFEFEKVNFSETRTIGIAVNFALPFFHANGGGRAKASKEIITASLNLKRVAEESRLDMYSWISVYRNFKKSLKSISKKEELEKKHQKIESLFKRGIISTSLVIEAHRQLIEFTDTRFEFELGAVEAKWQIYKIIGELKTRKL